MKGWKTWTAAMLSAAYGIAGYIQGLHDGSAAVEFCVAALALVGIGHKIEKSVLDPKSTLIVKRDSGGKYIKKGRPNG